MIRLISPAFAPCEAAPDVCEFTCESCDSSDAISAFNESSSVDAALLDAPPPPPEARDVELDVLVPLVVLVEAEPLPLAESEVEAAADDDAEAALPFAVLAGPSAFEFWFDPAAFEPVP